MNATSHHKDTNGMRGGHYRRLLLMTVLSFAAMYMLMYAMVNSWSNVLNSLNQVYMAGLMASSMVIIELAVMASMYPDKRRNFLAYGLSVLALVGCWLLIRQQTAISDKQFLRSMIPHHAGAILMCERASIEDPEVEDLCRQIVSSQKEEIEKMKTKLNELSGTR